MTDVFKIFGSNYYNLSFANKIKIADINVNTENKISKFFVLTLVVNIAPRIIPKKINPNNYLPFDIPGLEIIIALFATES